ncbi:unnamed protein product [Choristocarpus tenellus]
MFASPLFWQIRYLVTNLTKKNLKSSIAELNQLIALYGEDARLFLLQCLVEETGFKEQKAHSHHPGKDAQKIQLLQLEVAQATAEPNFVTAVCRALEGSAAGVEKDNRAEAHTRHTGRGGGQSHQQGPHRITEEFLSGFCRSLKLSPPQQVAVALGLARSQNPFVSKEGVKFLIARVPGLAGGGGHLSAEALHSLVELVNLNEDVVSQPHLAKGLLHQIREAHQELAQLAFGHEIEGDTGGGQGVGRVDTGGGPGGGSVGGGGGSVATAPGSGSDSAFLEAEALALVPLFVEHTSEMNYLNQTGGAASLAADVAGIASSIGRGGNLSLFLRDLGHTCCSNAPTLRQAIRESGLMVDERQVAQLITMLANNCRGGGGEDGELSSALTNSLFSSGEGQAQGVANAGRDGGGPGGAGQGQGLWNLEVVKQVLAEDYSKHLDWAAVAMAFDHDDFYIPDQNAFLVLLALFRSGAGREIPLERFFMRWRNRRGQLSLLRASISTSPQAFSFASSPTKQTPLEGVDPSAATPNGAWLSLDLVATLLSLAGDAELYAQVRDVVLKSAVQCPEMLLLALAAFPVDVGGNLRAEMLSRLLPLYFRPNRNPHAATLIRRLWQINRRLVVESCVKSFNMDSTLPSVVYVSQFVGFDLLIL